MGVDADTADVELADPDTAETGESDRADIECENAVGDDDAPRARRDVCSALIAGVLIVATLSGLVAWLGERTYVMRHSDERREVFLQAARQGALNLTTMKHTEIEKDVQRVLDSSTGDFYSEFEQREGPFIEVVKKLQSSSEGSITESALESEDGDTAQVLVAVTVNTSAAGPAQEEPRAWRMRITMHEEDGTAKMSHVEFVP